MNKANISWLVGVDLLTSVYFSIIYSYYFSFSFIFGLLGLVVKNKNKECYNKVDDFDVLFTKLL